MVEHICIFIVTVVLIKEQFEYLYNCTLYVYVHVYAKYLYMYNVLCGVSLLNTGMYAMSESAFFVPSQMMHELRRSTHLQRMCMVLSE